MRLLVCGASNLSVDNILERLLALPAPSQGAKLVVTRIGHPARVIPHEGALNSTLEAQAERSDEVRGSRALFVDDSIFSIRPLWRET
jgi:DNA polymerase alpha-associated DNA helicase A